MRKKEDLFVDLINKQFEIAGYDTSIYNYEWAKITPEWYRKLTITEDKENEFKAFFYKKIKRNKRISDREYGMFILMYGLMTKVVA